MVKYRVSVRLETAPTGVSERVSCASLVSIKYLANEPLSCVLLFSVAVLFTNAQALTEPMIAWMTQRPQDDEVRKAMRNEMPSSESAY